MFKKNLLPIVFALIVSVNVSGMDSFSDAANDETQELNIEPIVRTQFQYNNNFRAFYDKSIHNNYPRKPYNDPDATFGQKLKGSFAEGCWETWSGVPALVGSIIIKTMAELAVIKAVQYINGTPADKSAESELALEAFAREHLADIALTQMQLKVNGEALHGLKAEQKFFEHDEAELKNIEQRKQDLLQNRKMLSTKLHSMVNASAQIEQAKKQPLFSYPKAA